MSGQPLARLIPEQPSSQARIPGLNKGQITLTEDFDHPLPDKFWD